MKLYIIIIWHHLTVWGMVLAPFFCLVNEPWYITLCITVFVIRTGTTGGRCILTELEERERARLGMPSIGGKFIKHYYSWMWGK